MTTIDSNVRNQNLLAETRAALQQNTAAGWLELTPGNSYGYCVHCGCGVGSHGYNGMQRLAVGSEAYTASRVSVCDYCLVQVYAEPKEGMAVTFSVGSDRYPGTIVRVAPSKKIFWFTKDQVVGKGRLFAPTDGESLEARRRADGRFRTTGRHGQYVHLGYREISLDPHF